MSVTATTLPIRERSMKKTNNSTNGTQVPLKRTRTQSSQRSEVLCTATERLTRVREYRRRESVQDGEDFLKDFLEHHFETHIDHIRITCNLTLEDIKMIGNEEDQKLGVHACKKLFNAPVINDEIGYLLWCELRQGDGLDHSHERQTEDDIREECPFIEGIRECRDRPIPNSMTTRYSGNEAFEIESICRIIETWTTMVREPTDLSLSPSKSLSKSIHVRSISYDSIMQGFTDHAHSVQLRTRTGRRNGASVNCVMKCIRRRASNSVEYFAASLANGYTY
ncbi:hypothetical protein F5Y15DRAFT_424342 [Xylariaceae sp. FL0016]|nr:hypothetical protein F5Y15DRAFT_424342 [Xylariaceae sp. FL0016]